MPWSSIRYLTKNIYAFRTFNSDFLYIEALLTNLNSEQLEKEDKINVT